MANRGNAPGGNPPRGNGGGGQRPRPPVVPGVRGPWGPPGGGGQQRPPPVARPNANANANMNNQAVIPVAPPAPLQAPPPPAAPIVVNPGVGMPPLGNAVPNPPQRHIVLGPGIADLIAVEIPITLKVHGGRNVRTFDWRQIPEACEALLRWLKSHNGLQSAQIHSTGGAARPGGFPFGRLNGINYCPSCPQVACKFCSLRVPKETLIGDLCFVCAVRSALMKNQNVTAAECNVTVTGAFLGVFDCGSHQVVALPLARDPSSQIRRAVLSCYVRKPVSVSQNLIATLSRLHIPETVVVDGTAIKVYVSGDVENRHSCCAAARRHVELAALAKITRVCGTGPVVLIGPCFKKSTHPNVTVFGRHPSWENDEAVDDGFIQDLTRGDAFRRISRMNGGVVYFADRVYHLTPGEQTIICNAVSRGVSIYASHMRLPKGECRALMWPMGEIATTMSNVELISWVNRDGKVDTRVVGNPRPYRDQCLPDNLSMLGIYHLMALSIFKVDAINMTDLHFNNAETAPFEISRIMPVVLPSSVLSSAITNTGNGATNVASLLRRVYSNHGCLQSDFEAPMIESMGFSEIAENWVRTRGGLSMADELRIGLTAQRAIGGRWFSNTLWRWGGALPALIWGFCCWWFSLFCPLPGLWGTRLAATTCIVLSVLSLGYDEWAAFNTDVTRDLDVRSIATLILAIGWLVVSWIRVGFTGQERRVWFWTVLVMIFASVIAMVVLTRTHVTRPAVVELEVYGFTYGSEIQREVFRFYRSHLGSYTSRFLPYYESFGNQLSAGFITKNETVGRFWDIPYIDVSSVTIRGTKTVAEDSLVWWYPYYQAVVSWLFGDVGATLGKFVIVSDFVCQLSPLAFFANQWNRYAYFGLSVHPLVLGLLFFAVKWLFWCIRHSIRRHVDVFGPPLLHVGWWSRLFLTLGTDLTFWTLVLILMAPFGAVFWTLYAFVYFVFFPVSLFGWAGLVGLPFTGFAWFLVMVDNAMRLKRSVFVAARVVGVISFADDLKWNQCLIYFGMSVAAMILLTVVRLVVRAAGKVREHRYNKGLSFTRSFIPKLVPDREGGKFAGIVGRDLRSVTVKASTVVDPTYPGRGHAHLQRKNEKLIVGGIGLMRGPSGPAVMYFAEGEAAAYLKRNIQITAPVAQLGHIFMQFWNGALDRAVTGDGFYNAADGVVSHFTGVITDPDRFSHAAKFTGYKALSYHRLAAAYLSGDLGFGDPYQSRWNDIIARVTNFTKLENTSVRIAPEVAAALGRDVTKMFDRFRLESFLTAADYVGKPRVICVTDPRLDVPGNEALGPILLTHTIIDRVKSVCTKGNSLVMNFDQSLTQAAKELSRRIKALPHVDVLPRDVVHALTKVYSEMGHNPEMECRCHILGCSFCSKTIIPAMLDGVSDIAFATDFPRLVFSVSSLCHDYQRLNPGVYLSKVRSYLAINSACPVSLALLRGLESHLLKYEVPEIIIPCSSDYVPVWSDGEHTPHPHYSEFWDIIYPYMPFEQIMAEVESFVRALSELPALPPCMDHDFSRMTFLHGVQLDDSSFPLLCKLLTPGFKFDRSEPECGEALSICARVSNSVKLALSDKAADYETAFMEKGVDFKFTEIDNASRGVLKNITTMIALFNELEESSKSGIVIQTPFLHLVGAGRPWVAALSFLGLPSGVVLVEEHDQYNGVQYGWSNLCNGQRSTKDVGIIGWTCTSWAYTFPGCDIVADWTADGFAFTPDDACHHVTEIVKNHLDGLIDVESLGLLGSDYWSRRDANTLTSGGAADGLLALFRGDDFCAWMIDNWHITYLDAHDDEPPKVVYHVLPTYQRNGATHSSLMGVLLNYCLTQVCSRGILFDDIGMSNVGALHVNPSFMMPRFSNKMTSVVKIRGDAKEFEISRATDACFSGRGGEFEDYPMLELSSALKSQFALTEPLGVRRNSAADFIPERYLVVGCKHIPLVTGVNVQGNVLLSRMFNRANAGTVCRIPLAYAASPRKDPLDNHLTLRVVDDLVRATSLVRATYIPDSTNRIKRLSDFCLANDLGWLNGCAAIMFDAASCDGSHQTDLPLMIGALVDRLRDVFTGDFSDRSEVLQYFARSWQSGQCSADVFNQLSGALSSGAPWTTLANTLRMLFITLQGMISSGVVTLPDPANTNWRDILEILTHQTTFVCMHTGDDSGVIVRVSSQATMTA